MGAVHVDATGVPISYTAVSGDIWVFVALRFGFSNAYLDSLNSVRRNGEDLYDGDIVNLDASTITSVGSQNGKVYDFPRQAEPPQIMLGGSVVRPARDGGSTEKATGAAHVDASGVPVSYTVASGDIWLYVAHRFGFTDAYLFSLNSVRRNGIGLYVGDIVNLDATTITSVGSQNGKVYDFPLRTSPHPPQH